MFDFAFNAQRFAVYLIPTLLGIIMHEVAHGSLRLTFSDYNTMEDVDYILKVLPGVIDRLRATSRVITFNTPLSLRETCI